MFNIFMTIAGDRLTISKEKLVVICQQWRIKELALFGSVLREDFREDSDIDLLISFAPEAPQGLLTLAKIKCHLEDSLHRNVDLVLKEAIPEGDNWIRRQEILNTAVIIYES
ncbi:DNA polymerase beta domain protein region [[Leptolyngbya] sp. PCC 7376]|uniref:nucleotidyltransferase family protein n=1 Tax=[Leptolyngbya] sp. PCC 7376 TaxID=111781 RepID=UPI00029F17B0|nr:nucleotidyltransferase domain-containing protein [[Leptolyngbya] sp. PCC 7376]AFY38562.1 DNA polymerase beta domain protein region [[Leptolyngbya] sp. PCC 7376]